MYIHSHIDYVTGLETAHMSVTGLETAHMSNLVNASHGEHSVCPRLRQLNDALLEPVLVL